MNRRILIIDDDQNLLNLYQDFLSPELAVERTDTPKFFVVTPPGMDRLAMKSSSAS